MNWYKSEEIKRLDSLEKSLRRSYQFLKREDIEPELREMILENHDQKAREYKALKRKLAEIKDELV